MPVHKRQPVGRFACGDPFPLVSRMPDRDSGTLLPVDGGKRHRAGRHAVGEAQVLAGRRTTIGADDPGVT